MPEAHFTFSLFPGWCRANYGDGGDHGEVMAFMMMMMAMPPTPGHADHGQVGVDLLLGTEVALCLHSELLGDRFSLRLILLRVIFDILILIIRVIFVVVILIFAHLCRPALLSSSELLLQQRVALVDILLAAGKINKIQQF